MKNDPAKRDEILKMLGFKDRSQFVKDRTGDDKDRNKPDREE